MNTQKINKTDVGIIVGRFMVHELHDAHRELIQSVRDCHPRVIIFLGLSPCKNTLNNPLEFKHRKVMIEETFSDIEIHYIDDVGDDEEWSKNLDKQIQKWITYGQTVTLYGGRDSFIFHYRGKYNTCELEPKLFVSGTETRKQIINFYHPSKDFRAGIIAATGLRYPTAFQTVDVAIFNKNNELLIARKPSEKLWRFIGGFSDPISLSLEDDVRREVKEEAGIEIDNIKYLASSKIDDWRYRNEKDCIKTAFFTADYLSGTPNGGDDIVEVKWTDFPSIDIHNIHPGHRILMEILFTKYNRK